jgi:hypothetical protein
VKAISIISAVAPSTQLMSMQTRLSLQSTQKRVNAEISFESKCKTPHSPFIAWGKHDSLLRVAKHLWPLARTHTHVLMRMRVIKLFAHS